MGVSCKFSLKPIHWFYHGSIGFFRLFFPGFIGRLDAQKGYDLLLESLVEVLEESNGTVGQWVLWPFGVLKRNKSMGINGDFYGG